MDVAELRQRLAHEPQALPLPESLLQSNLSPNYALVDEALAWQQAANNHHLVSLDDPHYPPLLKQINDPRFPKGGRRKRMTNKNGMKGKPIKMRIITRKRTRKT